MKRRDRTEALRERLEEEHCKLLVLIREAADEIERMSAGQIFSPKGEKAVLHLDALTVAEASLSAAIGALSEREQRERAG